MLPVSGQNMRVRAWVSVRVRVRVRYVCLYACVRAYVLHVSYHSYHSYVYLSDHKSPGLWSPKTAEYAK